MIYYVHMAYHVFVWLIICAYTLEMIFAFLCKMKKKTIFFFQKIKIYFVVDYIHIDKY